MAPVILPSVSCGADTGILCAVLQAEVVRLNEDELKVIGTGRWSHNRFVSAVGVGYDDSDRPERDSDDCILTFVHIFRGH